MFGLIAKDNPNIKPLLLHDFPNGVFPLRKEFKLNNDVKTEYKIISAI